VKRYRTVKRYQTPLGLQVLEFVEVRKQFFVAQLHKLTAQPLAREESKFTSKKIRQLPLEGRPVPSHLVPSHLINLFPFLPSPIIKNAK